MIEKCTIHAGHGNPNGLGCGAVGILDESKATREVVAELMKCLPDGMASNITYYGNISAKVILKVLISRANTTRADVHLSIHMNASATHTGNGVEAWVYDKKSKGIDLANKLCIILSDRCGYKNRGVKVSKSLGFLKETNAPSVLLEVGFVDNQTDAALYDAKKIAHAIRQALYNSIIA